MSHSELQREYTLQDAISALISFDNDMPAGERAAGWLVKTMADLEAKAEAAAKVERIVVAEVRPGDTVIVTLREHLGVSMHEWPKLQRAFTAQFRQVTGILDLRVVLVDGADVSVLRVAPETTESDFEKLATLPEDTPAPVTTTQVCDQGHLGCADEHFRASAEARRAPDHQPDAVPAKDDEELCRLAAWKSIDAPGCALPLHHKGKHMDAMAIAHAGKAGEVWE